MPPERGGISCAFAVAKGGRRLRTAVTFRFSAPISTRSFKPCQRFLLAKQVRSPLWLKICPTRHIFLTRRAPKAAEAILTVFPINAKTARLSPKTAKRKVHHILLRRRDAVSTTIFSAPKVVPTDRKNTSHSPKMEGEATRGERDGLAE